MVDADDRGFGFHQPVTHDDFLYVEGGCTKYTIGVYGCEGAPGDGIAEWLRYGQLSLTQAGAIAGNWKGARRAGHDPVAEWEALLAREREAEAASKAGKKSAPAIRYRLDRLAAHLGEQKIRDVMRKDVIAALDKIADGQREGQTAKQLAGEVLVQAKRLWRFAEAREWVEASCIEKLARKDFDARPVKRDVTRCVVHDFRRTLITRLPDLGFPRALGEWNT